jgi:hypothetical protein
MALCILHLEIPFQGLRLFVEGMFVLGAFRTSQESIEEVPPISE